MGGVTPRPSGGAVAGYAAAPYAPMMAQAGQGQAAMSGLGAGLATNPMQQAAQAQQAALAGTAGAGTVAGSNIQQYQNPYIDQVIKANEADILRGAKMGINELDTAATRAGAFGGSRHGVALGEYGRNVAEQLAQSSAGLRQQGFANAQQMAQQDIQNRLSQAAQMSNLGQQSFGYGNTIQQQMAQQGAMQQALNQALIDAAKGQFGAYQQAPAAGLSIMTQALGASPHGETTTSQKNLGVMDYLTAGATLYGMSDIRLKTNITHTRTLDNGVKVYSWNWSEEGRDLAHAWQPSHGVIAQEVAEIYPEAVTITESGYLAVDYSHPALQGVMQ
jgi:hypothetical protein